MPRPFPSRPRIAIWASLLALVACAACTTTGAPDPGPSPSARVGEALYARHCASCHTTEVHWRETRLAVNWPSLRAQVRRWQGNIGVPMDDAQIDAVTRYLNETYYGYAAGSE